MKETIMNEIKSRKNPLVVHLKKLGVEAAYRHSTKEFFCDGEKLLFEAVTCGADIKTVLTSGSKPDWLPDHIPVYSASQDIIDAASPLRNPQNIIFSCGMPAQMERPDIGSFHIILEGIQDPGNVGTIIRTAAAFNIASVILTGSCADPYNPKTIRATMGAIYKQPMIAMALDEIAGLKAQGLKLFAAALDYDSKDLRTVSLKNAAVIIGSEGSGLTDEALAICDEKIIIPMSPNSESLNAAVAAAIVMWQAAQT
jgi:TrmH family RNA methyltransferase